MLIADKLLERLLDSPAAKAIGREMVAETADARRRAIVELERIDHEYAAERDRLIARADSAQAKVEAAKAALKEAEREWQTMNSERSILLWKAETRKNQQCQSLRATASADIADAIQAMTVEIAETERESIGVTQRERTGILGRDGRELIQVKTNAEEVQRRVAALRAGRQMLEALTLTDYGDADQLAERIEQIRSEVQMMARLPSDAGLVVV